MPRGWDCGEWTGARHTSLFPNRRSQINTVHSGAVSDYGNNDTSTLEKEITAVVSAKFSLE